MTESLIKKSALKKALDNLINIHWLICRNIYNFNPEKNFLIFADPRGGSTWLAETLNKYISEAELLWEPLQIALVEEFNNLPFSWRQYIPEDASWPEAEEKIKELFSGQILNNHICRKTNPVNMKKAKRLIIKFCRANMMLPWIVENFKIEKLPILLIRHPFSVAASKIHHGHWDNRKKLATPSTPFKERYQKYENYFKHLETKAETLVASWCITNMVPLSSERNNRDWITVYYEHLIKNPEKELRRIFRRWERPFPEKILKTIRKPSSTTKEDTFRKSIDSQLAKWQKKFSESEIEKMEMVLKHFGVEVYSKATMPHVTDR